MKYKNDQFGKMNQYMCLKTNCFKEEILLVDEIFSDNGSYNIRQIKSIDECSARKLDMWVQLFQNSPFLKKKHIYTQKMQPLKIYPGDW